MYMVKLASILGLPRWKELLVNFIYLLWYMDWVSYCINIAQYMLPKYSHFSVNRLSSKFGYIHLVLNCPIVNCDIFNIIFNLIVRAAMIIILCWILTSLHLKHNGLWFHSWSSSFKLELKIFVTFFMIRTQQQETLPLIEKTFARFITAKTMAITYHRWVFFVSVGWFNLIPVRNPLKVLKCKMPFQLRMTELIGSILPDSMHKI